MQAKVFCTTKETMSGWAELGAWENDFPSGRTKLERHIP